MKTLLTGLLLFCGNILFAQINFEHGTWSEIKAKAKAENKLIFVDAYTTWCGPCKWMAANTFTNPEVAGYYNKTFINAKMDMEKGEGIELAKLHEVKFYPTLLFVNAEGMMVHRTVGALDPESFLSLGKQAVNPATQLASLQKKYESGERNPGFITGYLQALKSAALPYDAALEAYFLTQKQEDWINRNNWNIIYEFVNKKEAKEFKHLLKNYDSYAKNYTADSVIAKINQVCYAAFEPIIYPPQKAEIDLTAYENLKKEILEINYPEAQKVVLEMESGVFFMQEKYEDYSQTCLKLLHLFPSENPNELNSYAWNFYEKVNDKAALEKALEWSKKSNELAAGDPALMDTYACLLAKLDRKKEAIEWETKALEIIAKNPENYPDDLSNSLKTNLENWKK